MEYLAPIIVIIVFVVWVIRPILVVTVLSSYHSDSRNGNIFLIGPVSTPLFLPVSIVFSTICRVAAKMIG